MDATCQVSEAAKRALAELRKSHPDVDETNIKVDLPVERAAPRPGAVPGLNGGVILPAYMGARALGIGGPGVGIRMADMAAIAGMGMGAGIGAGMGPGMGVPPMGPGVGVGNNAFMFGAGQAHQFAPPAFGAPRPVGLNPQALAHQAAIPAPAIPLAQAKGIRRRAPVMAAGGGGGGRQRKGR